MLDEFYSDEILLMFYEISSLSLLVILAKLLVLNIMKLIMKPPLKIIWETMEAGKRPRGLLSGLPQAATAVPVLPAQPK